HGRVVDVLRERFPKRVAAELEVVARHAEAAGRRDDAITYYGRAGERAQARRTAALLRLLRLRPSQARLWLWRRTADFSRHGVAFRLDRRFNLVCYRARCGPRVFALKETIGLSGSSPRSAFRSTT